jgi:hypothetical protein
MDVARLAKYVSNCSCRDKSKTASTGRIDHGTGPISELLSRQALTEISESNRDLGVFRRCHEIAGFVNEPPPVLLPRSIGECFRVRVEELITRLASTAMPEASVHVNAPVTPMPRKPGCEITLGVSSSILSSGTNGRSLPRNIRLFIGSAGDAARNRRIPCVIPVEVGLRKMTSDVHQCRARGVEEVTEPRAGVPLSLAPRIGIRVLWS